MVVEPIIPLAIMTREGFKLYDFLVDSGADFTLLPKHFAFEIGIDLAKCKKSTTLGVEGRGMIIYHASILLRIGDYQSKTRCAFANHDKIPPLLGRLDVFSLYNITFHAGRRSIIFKKARRADRMKKEYNFSKGVRGKFFSAEEAELVIKP